MGTDEKYMQRCLDLASLGRGNTSPNPLVGAVVVYKDKIIGEGYHHAYGQAHAEVHAINAVHDKSLLKKSTIYVNLEPCSHSGKTPPCSDLIIKSGISRIVIGRSDPNPRVSGKGIRKLKEAGCEVHTGILEKQGWELNRRFFTYHNEKRPFVILKWAESKDGFIDTVRTDTTPIGPNWITGQLGRTLVHKWRANEQAVIVGSQTIHKDNPRLTVRYWAGRQPVRITLSRNANFHSGINFLDGTSESLIYTQRKILPEGKCEVIEIDYKRDIIQQILEDLYKREIQSLMVEGGSELLKGFIASGRWDEARVFSGDQEFVKGIQAPLMHSEPVFQITFDKTQLSWFRNFEQIPPQKY